MAASFAALEARVIAPAPRGEYYSDRELDGTPEPVRRYFHASLEPGVPLARSVRLRMRGQIRIGRWAGFRAREVLTPHAGFVWAARAARVIVGNDHYADGSGSMEWKLAGLKTVARAEGRDVSRAAAERAGGEAIWVPTALLPRFGVTWTADDDAHLAAHFEVDGHPVDLRLRIDDRGRIESVVFDRWREPDGASDWTTAPFGGDVTAHRTFHGFTIPSAGRFGWYHGTERWSEGEFFRYEITDLDPIP